MNILIAQKKNRYSINVPSFFYKKNASKNYRRVNTDTKTKNPLYRYIETGTVMLLCLSFKKKLLITVVVPVLNLVHASCTGTSTGTGTAIQYEYLQIY